MNPLLLKKFRLMLPRRPSWPVCMFSRQNVQDFVTNNQILFSEPRASWRRMVTQQPPILIITGSITRRVHGHHEARGRSHTCDDGVRMGLFFDLVTSSFGKKQSPFDFMIQWIHEDSMPWNVIWTIELHALLRAAGPVGYIWFSCNELSPNGSNGRYLLDDTVRYWWPFGL